jgi:hypothetical protein
MCSSLIYILLRFVTQLFLQEASAKQIEIRDLQDKKRESKTEVLLYDVVRAYVYNLNAVTNEKIRRGVYYLVNR